MFPESMQPGHADVPCVHCRAMGELDAVAGCDNCDRLNGIQPLHLAVIPATFISTMSDIKYLPEQAAARSRA